MGKSLPKLPSIKIDSGTLKNVVKNFTPVGIASGAAHSLGLTKNNWTDEAWKALSPKEKQDAAARGDTTPAQNEMQGISDAYSKEALEARRKNLEDNTAFTSQLQKQAAGQGPSLATAQLKMAQNRNLAQTLGAAQSAGGSPLATRQLLANRGAASRDLAELGGVQRMQEQQQAQAMLGAQLGQAGATSRADIGQGFDISKAPVDWDDKQKDRAQQLQMQRESIQAQKDMAADAGRNQIWGSLLGAGATVGAGYLKSDEKDKKAPDDTKNAKGELSKKLLQQYGKLSKIKNIGDGISVAGDAFAEALSSDEAKKQSSQGDGPLPAAKKEVQGFLDALEAKKYEYKDPSAPGAADGERVGIIAQDLERTPMGAALVKDTAQGKMVDTVQGFGAVLAAQSELNKRLKALEGRKKS